MIYKCKKRHPELTVGRRYKEWAKYPNSFNAIVENDAGDVTHYPRDEFFDIEK